MPLHTHGRHRTSAGLASYILVALGAVLCCSSPGLAQGVNFTTEASVFYSMGGRTLVTNQSQINYSDTRTLTTVNPLAEPARLVGSIGGTQGSGSNFATVFANTNLEGSAGLMRARIDGSATAGWIYGSALAEARITGITSRVGWKDAFYIDGNPSTPQPGRPLLVQAFLNVSGAMSSEIIGAPSVLNIQMKLTAKDHLQRNLLNVVPPYFGSFATEYNSTSSSPGHVTREAPGTIPLLLMVNEGQYAWMDLLLELTATAVSQGTGIGLLDPRSTSLSFDADYGHTLSWGGITSVTDANTGLPVSGWSITSASGADYANAIPEPAMSMLLACGLVALSHRRPPKHSRLATGR